MFFARSDWLLDSISEYPVLFTDSPSVPPSEQRQTLVSYEQNGFPVCCRNKLRNFTNNQISCSRNKRRRWRNSFGSFQPRPQGFSLKKWEKPWGRGWEVLIGKSLSVWLEFIDETGEKGFGLYYQCKLSSSLRLL